MGRRKLDPDRATRRRMVYLNNEDWQRLQSAGDGNTSKAIRRLLANIGDMPFIDYETKAIIDTTRKGVYGRDNGSGNVGGGVWEQLPPAEPDNHDGDGGTLAE